MHPMPGMSVNTATRFPDPQNMRQKSLAFFLSALISSGLFASVFFTHKYPIQATPASDPPQWIVSPKLDIARPVMPPVQDKRITQSTKNTPARNNRRPPAVPAETTTAAALSSASTLNAAAAEAQLSMETAPATGKLMTDRQAIARAYQDSKTDIQKMAEASGKHLGDPPVSKSEQIQKQLAYARIPGCTDRDALKFVPPEVAGIQFAGLLTAPFLAKALLTGKCKSG